MSLAGSVLVPGGVWRSEGDDHAWLVHWRRAIEAAQSHTRDLGAFRVFGRLTRACATCHNAYAARTRPDF
jgi:hypothetical protein